MRPRLTYANVMATIAVFIALGSASYAAMKLPKNSVGTKQLKNSAVTAAKIKSGAVTGAKVNLASLGTVPSATSAANAGHADTASTATSANPEAFAHIGGNGTVDPANSKGVSQANVTTVDGSYCFSGLPFQPRGGQATIDYSDANFQAAQFDLGDGGGCPVGTQAFVYTYTPESGFSPTTFYVLFYR